MPDLEIKAMTAISDAFDPLDAEQRGRVMRWAGDKYGVALAASGKGERVGGSAKGSEGTDTHNDDEHYEHFADLYNAANPTTNPQKALVAAYWVQVIQGKAAYGSQELNAELKELGHYLPDINKNLTSSIESKPALMLQIKKSGKSKQARKTYKMSAAGIKAVEKLIAGGDDE